MINPPDHIPDLRRIYGLYAVIVAMMLCILARLWYLQIARGPEFAEQAETRHTRTIRRLAPRGTIEDVHGKTLATSRFRFVVSVIPDELKKNPNSLPRLAGILKRTPADLAETIEQEMTTPFDPAPVADNVDLSLLTQIEEQQTDLAGVLITKDPERYYVDDQLCTHLLGIARPISREELDKLKNQGYRGGDYIGKEGIEKAFEQDLRGRDGGQVVSVNARGRVLASMDDLEPQSGKTLRLTLDLPLQQAASAALKDEFDHAGHPGAAVAIDPTNGAVLALASYPGYDLNRYGQEIGQHLKDPARPLIDRAVNSGYPCGSTFKLITAAAGLESGVITPSTRIYCPGYLQVGNHRFRCDKRSGHGSMDLANAIGASCDVYFWRVGQMVEIDRLAKMARRFGLGSAPGIDLPLTRSSKGLIPTPEWKKKAHHEVWYPGDTLLTGIGQGFVKVTPLQLACYTAALANGGTRWRPQLVAEVRDPNRARGAPVRTMQPESLGTLGISPQTRDSIVEGMRRAMQRGGTAYGSAIPGLDVAGKTGTAQVTNKNDNSVFVCYAPADNPRIAIAVLVENGGHGSDVAAPIARRMLINYLKIQNAGETKIGGRLGAD